MIVVANAGPLIALAYLDQLDLLHILYGQIHISSAVRSEVVTSGRGRPGALEVGTAPWILTHTVSDTTAIAFLRERLDLGESEAIVLAIELKADLLLIDESRGRRIAEARGISKTGTIGTLVMAKKRGLIVGVTPLLDSLKASGFRMSDALYVTARSLAGEG
ncbi:MAG: DUF3368 domain-containing protein [Halieaceae bacterium]|nr:DUF3368 domain-containing protein [Halieaceae bacterium]